MTRQDLLDQIQALTGQQRRQALRVASFVAIFSLVGVWAISDGKTMLGLATLLFFGVGGSVGVLLKLMTPNPSYGGGRLEAHPALLARAGMVVLMLASVAGVVAFVLYARGWRQIEMVVLGGAWTLIVVLILASFLRRGPVVTVDADGYFDRRASRAMIPWDRITGVDVITIKKQSFYRLQTLDDSGSTLLRRLNLLVGVRGITINCVGLDVCDGDVLLAIHAYRPALLDTLPRLAA